MTASLNGVPWSSIDTLVTAAPLISNGVQHGDTAEQIVAALTPAMLAALETVANLFFPGAGTAIAIVASLIRAARPMTPEEEQRWFERAQGEF